MARNDALLKLHAKLVSRRQELLGTIDEQLSGMQAIGSGDELDFAAVSMNTELTSQLAEHESRELKQIERALMRLRDGTYGVCEVTGRKIPIERLNALPYTNVTVEAQRELENNPELREELEQRADRAMRLEGEEDYAADEDDEDADEEEEETEASADRDPDEEEEEEQPRRRRPGRKPAAASTPTVAPPAKPKVPVNIQAEPAKRPSATKTKPAAKAKPIAAAKPIAKRSVARATTAARKPSASKSSAKSGKAVKSAKAAKPAAKSKTVTKAKPKPKVKGKAGRTR